MAAQKCRDLSRRETSALSAADTQDFALDGVRRPQNARVVAIQPVSGAGARQIHLVAISTAVNTPARESWPDFPAQSTNPIRRGARIHRANLLPPGPALAEAAALLGRGRRDLDAFPGQVPSSFANRSATSTVKRVSCVNFALPEAIASARESPCPPQCP